MDSKKKTGKKSENGQTAQEQIGDRITYSETVRVNIGDYEHRDIFMSYATNRGPKEDRDETFKRAQLFVRKKLFGREKKIRLQSQEFVDFDTKAKLP